MVTIGQTPQTAQKDKGLHNDQILEVKDALPCNFLSYTRLHSHTYGMHCTSLVDNCLSVTFIQTGFIKWSCLIHEWLILLLFSKVSIL